MARTFHVDIMSASSIDKLIKDLTNYQNDFNVRVRVFIRRLTRIAIEEIEKDISDAAITISLSTSYVYAPGLMAAFFTRRIPPSP